MKFNTQLKTEIENYLDYIILVEGKKDVLALKSLGFEKVFAIHKTGIPLKESIESICLLITKKDKVCILTDLDKRGKQFYLLIKKIFQERGIKLDSSLRGLLIKSGLSHIEGIDKFMQKVDRIN